MNTNKATQQSNSIPTDDNQKPKKPTSSVPSGNIQIPLDTIDDINNESPLSPDEMSEIGVSGSTPDPESDDDMLENEHQVGLYTKSTDDDAPELNIADQIEKAEKYHHDH